jgi:hypothetical protein
MERWPRSSRDWFAGCTSEEDLLTGTQLSVLGWLVAADWPGVWQASSTFSTFGWVQAPEQPDGMVPAHPAPYGCRVVLTPRGPALWVPGDERYDYRGVFRTFVAHYGYEGEVSALDVDHVVSRSAFYRRKHARRTRSAPDGDDAFVAPARDEWFFVMAARQARNRSWGYWESSAPANGFLGLMSILKSLDVAAPAASDRADAFASYSESSAKKLTPLLGFGPAARLPDPLPRLSCEATAAQKLGLVAGQVVATETWVRWALMSEAMEILGA